MSAEVKSLTVNHSAVSGARSQPPRFQSTQERGPLAVDLATTSTYTTDDNLQWRKVSLIQGYISEGGKCE